MLINIPSELSRNVTHPSWVLNQSFITDRREAVDKPPLLSTLRHLFKHCVIDPGEAHRLLRARENGAGDQD